MQRTSLRGIGLAYLALNDVDNAQSTADELKVKTESAANPSRIWQYCLLQGKIELAKTNYSQAIAYFNQASSLLPVYSLFQQILAEATAEAFTLAGDLENAQEHYLRVIRLNKAETDLGDVYAKAHSALGTIYADLGQTAEAIQNYQRFLDLWKDADPGLPEVVDAQKRLGELISSSSGRR